MKLIGGLILLSVAIASVSCSNTKPFTLGERARAHSPYETLRQAERKLGEQYQLVQRWRHIVYDEKCSNKGLKSNLYLHLKYLGSPQVYPELLEPITTSVKLYAKRCFEQYVGTMNKLVKRVDKTARANLRAVLTCEFAEEYKKSNPGSVDDNSLVVGDSDQKVNEQEGAILVRNVKALRGNEHNNLETKAGFTRVLEARLIEPCRQLVSALEEWSSIAESLRQLSGGNLSSLIDDDQKETLFEYKFCRNARSGYLSNILSLVKQEDQ